MSGRTSSLLLRCEQSVNWVFNSNMPTISTHYLKVFNTFFILLQQYNFSIIKLKVLPKAFYVYLLNDKKKFILLRDYARRLYLKTGIITYNFFNESGIRFLELKNILRLQFLKYGRCFQKYRFAYILFLLERKKDFLFQIISIFICNLNTVADYAITFSKLNLTQPRFFYKKVRIKWFFKKTFKTHPMFIFKSRVIIYKRFKVLESNNVDHSIARWLRLLYSKVRIVQRKKLTSSPKLAIQNFKSNFTSQLKKNRTCNPVRLLHQLYGFFKLRYISIFLRGIISKSINNDYLLYIKNIFNTIRSIIIPSVHKRYWKAAEIRRKFIKVYIGLILFNSLLLNGYIQAIIRSTKFKKHVFNLVIFAKYLKLLYRKHIILLKGLKFKIAGKLGGKLRRSTYKFKIGTTSNFSFKIKTSYNMMPIYTKYGVFSSKIWLYRDIESEI